MVAAILWNEKPTAEIIIETTGSLKNLGDGLIAVSSEVANGTDLKTVADFELYLHDFADVPHAGGYFELHIVYQLDGTNYADGEDGDVAAPRLGSTTLHGIFPVTAYDAVQRIQVLQVPLGPHDFVVALVNKTGHGIANTDGSFLKIYRYANEIQ